MVYARRSGTAIDRSAVPATARSDVARVTTACAVTSTSAGATVMASVFKLTAAAHTAHVPIHSVLERRSTASTHKDAASTTASAACAPGSDRCAASRNDGL